MPSIFPSLKKAARIPSTEFAFHLFQEMKPGYRNLAICPYGARIALAMLWQGATGETRREMTQGLGLIEDPNRVANHYERVGRPLGFQLEAERRGLEMFTANSLWCDEGFSPKETYADTLSKDYLAHIQTVNFSAAESPGVVNQWARENTRDRIPRVFDSLKALSPMVLVNAAYFKGLWADPFEAELTKKEEFTLPSGKKEMVPMMGRSGDLQYCERGGAQIVRVPYKGGMSMCVVLPPKDMAFREFCGELRNVVGTEWTLGLSTREGHLRLPRFRVGTEADLSAPLRAMGINELFDAKKAALEGISDCKPLYVAEVRQSDFVEVNEEGTEAAAVTSIKERFGEYVPPPPPFEMVVNRPFVFAICDDFTETVIFLGALADPLESGPAQAR